MLSKTGHFKLHVDLSQGTWPNIWVNFKVMYPHFKEFHLSIKNKEVLQF